MQEYTKCHRCGRKVPRFPGKFGDVYRCEHCGIEDRVDALPPLPDSVKAELSEEFRKRYKPFFTQKPDAPTCPTCGAELEGGKCPNAVECKQCGGTGQTMKILTNGSSGWAWIDCPHCNGTGKKHTGLLDALVGEGDPNDEQ